MIQKTLGWAAVALAMLLLPLGWAFRGVWLALRVVALLAAHVSDFPRDVLDWGRRRLLPLVVLVVLAGWCACGIEKPGDVDAGGAGGAGGTGVPGVAVCTHAENYHRTNCGVTDVDGWPIWTCYGQVGCRLGNVHCVEFCP